MAEQKPTITNPSVTASRIAEQNKQAKEAADALKKEEEAKAAAEATAGGDTDASKDSGNDNITVGATTGGRMMQNPDRPAGVKQVTKAPGYYSRHAGRVRIGQKTWQWPMEAPLVPKEGEDDLKEHLDSMVERGLATLVEDKSE